MNYKMHELREVVKRMSECGGLRSVTNETVKT